MKAVERRIVRSGGKTTIFTIGYERRRGDELIAALKDAGVQHLADIRERPFSRKADFRLKALQSACEAAGIEYGSWTSLGTPAALREKVRSTGDLSSFFVEFRMLAQRTMHQPLHELAKLARKRTIALLCYERGHDECHRCVIAEMLAERTGATIIAIE